MLNSAGLKALIIHTAYSELNFEEVVEGLFTANFMGLAIKIDIGVKSSWSVYETSGKFWLQGFCNDFPDGKVNVYNAIQSELARTLSQ